MNTNLTNGETRKAQMRVELILLVEMRVEEWRKYNEKLQKALKLTEVEVGELRGSWINDLTDEGKI